MIFSDAVYGLIEIPDFLVRCVIDTPTFQRLRRIKQIGLGHLVYPSHDGTRFQHSIGAAHLAVRALASLKSSTERYVLPKLDSYEREEVKDVLETAWSLRHWFQYFMLLHDVGHGPLSHNYEDAAYEAKAVWGLKVPEASHRKLHEAVSKRIALAMLERECGNKTLAERLCKLSEVECDDPVKTVKSLLEPSPGAWDEEVLQGVRALFAFLSNGEIDVDRGDYLMRDAILAGTRVGLFDYERLYSVLAVVPSEGKTPVEVAVLDKGVSTVESMLLSRFYMYENVYFHKTTLLYSAIASRLMAWWMVNGKMGKIWEMKDIDFFDDCTFYKLLREENDLGTLAEVVKSRRHSLLYREEIINETVSGKVDGLTFPPYETEVDGTTLAEVVREEPQFLAYGASVKPFGKGGLKVFLRGDAKTKKITEVSPIVANLAKVTHLKFYLAAPTDKADLVREYAGKLRKALKYPD